VLVHAATLPRRPDIGEELSSGPRPLPQPQGEQVLGGHPAGVGQQLVEVVLGVQEPPAQRVGVPGGDPDQQVAGPLGWRVLLGRDVGDVGPPAAPGRPSNDSSTIRVRTSPGLTQSTVRPWPAVSAARVPVSRKEAALAQA
jgi:hypothetical protein